VQDKTTSIKYLDLDNSRQEPEAITATRSRVLDRALICCQNCQ